MNAPPDDGCQAAGQVRQLGVGKRPFADGRFSSVAEVLLGPFGVLALSLGYVSRVAPSAHVPRRRPAADGSSFTSLRGPPDCRSPAPCLRAIVARNHVCCKGGLGLDAARTRGAEKRRARGLARSANRELTRRRCLSVESEANAASSAAWPRERASQGSRRAAPTAEHKRRSQAKPAFAWGPSEQASEKHQTDGRGTTVRNGPITAIHRRPPEHKP